MSNSFTRDLHKDRPIPCVFITPNNYSPQKGHCLKIRILGTRGIPAKHGGFETFAEMLSLYLTKKEWEVTVYCQEEGTGPIYEDTWCGIHLIHIPIKQKGAPGTIVFDWKSTWHAAKRKTPILTLGYNTALFCMIYRLKGIKNTINMDGIEWKRKKWTFPEKTWLYINEKLAAILGNHLIADHPEIKNHLTRFTPEKKITVIPYSADILTSADRERISPFGLKENNYSLLIARPEPENSILEIVQAYSKEKRGIPLVILGEYTPASNAYHKQVIDAAGDEIQFIGAIYDKYTVQALRFFTRFYIHGHTVGGTNPSLIEALGAGSPVLAHNNRFNRWVAGKGARYFSSVKECEQELALLLQDNSLLATMKESSYQQFTDTFTSDKIHKAYEAVLSARCTSLSA